jgi:hypothetical protein
MRVVFLDFDGVLNRETDAIDEESELWTAAWLETDLVERLARLVASTGAKVVVSSSWRQRRSQAELADILAERGYPGGVHDVTARLPRSEEGEQHVRATEIAAWLTAHPEVASWIILDDERDLGPLAHRHVWTDPSVGLSEQNLAEARALLLG